MPINDPANKCLTITDLTKSATCPGSSDCNCGSPTRSRQLNCKFDTNNPNFCLYGVECSCSFEGFEWK